MKLFADTANLQEIEEALQRGFISGITTNPSILAKEPKGDYRAHIRKIINLCEKYKVCIPLSVEVFTADPLKMVVQAEEFIHHFGDYQGLNVKVPIGWDELGVIHELRQRGIRVNCTCCMAFNQAVMAASAGANYVSIFYGRIRDTGADAFQVVQRVRQVFKESGVQAEIIVGSIRHLYDVNDALLAGADIITIPSKFFKPMTQHPKTDEAVQQFLTDFNTWVN